MQAEAAESWELAKQVVLQFLLFTPNPANLQLSAHRLRFFEGCLRVWQEALVGLDGVQALWDSLLSLLSLVKSRQVKSRQLCYVVRCLSLHRKRGGAAGLLFPEQIAQCWRITQSRAVRHLSRQLLRISIRWRSRLYNLHLFLWPDRIVLVRTDLKPRLPSVGPLLASATWDTPH